MAASRLESCNESTFTCIIYHSLYTIPTEHIHRDQSEWRARARARGQVAGVREGGIEKAYGVWGYAQVSKGLRGGQGGAEVVLEGHTPQKS